MIKPFDYRRILRDIEPEIMAAIHDTLHSGSLILGPQTEAFEAEFAAWLGAPHCVGVASGTSALHLALVALGVGHGNEVITVANTCTPCISAIRLTGAVPLFIDVDPATLLATADAIESAITPATRCIIVTHLWGAMPEMESIIALARRHGIPIIEDCAQAVGAARQGRKAGCFGDIACFSFYPTKNLGAYGDAGAIACSDGDLALRVRSLRMYGYDKNCVAVAEGVNARIHELQAAILRVKLRHLSTWLEARNACAAHYDDALKDAAVRPLPRDPAMQHAFHQYVVRMPARAKLAAWLEAHGVGYGIHYAVPLHRMPAYANQPFSARKLPNTERGCDEILSLPLHEALTADEIAHVTGVVRRFTP